MNKSLFSIFVFVLFYLSAKGQEATDIFSLVAPSTVTIHTNNGSGSGFFVAPHIIATNYHVVKGAEKVMIVPYESEERYEINSFVAVSTESDVVLLWSADFTSNPLQFSEMPTEIGQKAFVIGSPYGLEATISDGLVSGYRNVKARQYVQISAPISKGSSGGPVVDEVGQVLGVATMSFAMGQNLNFAVPVETLKGLMKQEFNAVYPLSDLRSSLLTQWMHTGEISGVRSDRPLVEKLVLPSITQNYGNVFILQTTGYQPEIGEACYFISMLNEDIEWIATGTVQNLTGNECTVKVLETTRLPGSYADLVVIFDGLLNKY